MPYKDIENKRQWNKEYMRRRRLDPAFRELANRINKLWREKNSDKLTANYKKRWREKKESEYARTQRWFNAHPEKRREYSKQRRLRDPEGWKLRKRMEYRKHRSAYIKRACEWSKKNPHKKSDYAHKRRIQSQGGEDCSKKIALLMLERFCHWCCTRMTELNRTIDHVVPLSRGGRHISDNLVACCKSCNCKKNDKLVSEWIREAA